MSISPGEVFDLIIEKAAELRDAGIVGRVVIEGCCSFTVAASPDEDDAIDDVADDLNPLDDPETFGLRRDKRKAPTLRPAVSKS